MTAVLPAAIAAKALWARNRRLLKDAAEAAAAGDTAKAARLAELAEQAEVEARRLTKLAEEEAQAAKALAELPRLGPEELGYWQKALRNGKITEAELRKMVHPDSVDEILARMKKKGSGVHDAEKIIDSIEKSTTAAEARPRILRRAELRQRSTIGLWITLRKSAMHKAEFDGDEKP